MKCVYRKETRQIFRIADADAAALVKSGHFEYTTKDAWKEQELARNNTDE